MKANKQTEADCLRLAGGKARKASPSAPFTVMLAVTIPLTVHRSLNSRMHWAAAARVAKAEHAEAWGALRTATGEGRAWGVFAGRVTITLTRLGGRKLDDDNLAGVFKAVRDGVAFWLCRDDGDDRLTWEYRQEPGGPAGVRIELRSGGQS